MAFIHDAARLYESSADFIANENYTNPSTTNFCPIAEIIFNRTIFRKIKYDRPRKSNAN
jgi:hypothetical protein